MFYFPVASSLCQVDEYKGRLKKRLKECLSDLEGLVYWEQTLNFELVFDSLKQAEHEDLYREIKSFVGEI